jgi:hypothetical protein
VGECLQGSLTYARLNFYSVELYVDSLVVVKALTSNSSPECSCWLVLVFDRFRSGLVDLVLVEA